MSDLVVTLRWANVFETNVATRGLILLLLCPGGRRQVKEGCETMVKLPRVSLQGPIRGS